jgi:hypothetical protein
LFKQADDFSHICAKNAQIFGPDQFGLLLVAFPIPGYQRTLMATSKTCEKHFSTETGLKDGVNLHTANIHERKKSKQKHQSKALL